MPTTLTEQTTKVRCSGSEVAVGYAPGSGLQPEFPYDAIWCPCCGEGVPVYRDPINVRLREHFIDEAI